MKMIPDYVERFPSGTERTVHQLLSDCNVAGYALHSLNVARHDTKIWGEIDFILITRSGLIALEVKGDELRREGGHWYQRKQSTGQERSIENPFDQVSTAMFRVINELRDRNVKMATFGWGVVTRECEALPASPEYSPETHADFNECRDAKRFTDWLRKLEGYWQKRRVGRKAPKLNGREVDALAKALRPDCDLAVPLGKRLGVVGEKMKRFTEEQFARLDDINENDRILCRGGAGTGKTFLAMEALRRETALGRDCVYVARSQPLVDYLRQDHAGMKLLSFDELSCQTDTEPCDVLVVDEGQDLLSVPFLVVLEGALKGGLDKGRWRWFMDDHPVPGPLPLAPSI